VTYYYVLNLLLNNYKYFLKVYTFTVCTDAIFEPCVAHLLLIIRSFVYTFLFHLSGLNFVLLKDCSVPPSEYLSLLCFQD